MQLKRGPQLVAKKMGVDGVDCWLAGLCWFMVSSLSLYIFITLYLLLFLLLLLLSLLL